MKPRKRLVFLFLLPACLLYLVFFLIPAGWAFYYSLFDWSGFKSSMHFNQFGNYRELWRDAIFWRSLGNTLTIMLLGGIIVMAVAFILTVMLNSGIKGKKFYRAMIFLPNVVATIALTMLWQFAIYHPIMGLWKTFFQNVIGSKTIASFTWTAPSHVFWAMLIALVWISVGYYVVLLLAGVDRIPLELYEAARLEGAGQFQMFTDITVPLLWDVITVAFVMWSITSLKVFEFPFAFMGAGEETSLYTSGVYLYIMGFGKRQPIYRMGYASTIGVVLLLVVFFVIVVLRRAMRRDTVEY